MDTFFKSCIHCDFFITLDFEVNEPLAALIGIKNGTGSLEAVTRYCLAIIQDADLSHSASRTYNNENSGTVTVPLFSSNLELFTAI